MRELKTIKKVEEVKPKEKILIDGKVWEITEDDGIGIMVKNKTGDKEYYPFKDLKEIK